METINSLKVAAFRNSIRLFRDACILTKADRNESAFALAVLAYEELGKCLMADRVLDSACMNPGSEKWGKQSLSESMRKHDVKILNAAFDSGNIEFNKIPNWDTERKAAIYTDLIGDRVLSPRVSTEKVKDTLGEVMRALDGVEDIAYFGVEGDSTKKSDWMAKKDVAAVKRVYDEAMER